jgi:uncharacterized protein (TIGR01319 family)
MLFIDIGSTYTKLAVADLDCMRFVAASCSPTTIHDVAVGFQKAFKILTEQNVESELLRERHASSSAAGGLRMIAIGLVPSLTVEAARRAALGAGAKVVGAFSFKLTKRQMEEIVGKQPDIVLLAGGTDGGDEETVLHNARMISQSALASPVVMAGNSKAADEVESILGSAGKYLKVTDNVMPEMNKLCIEPVREVIREIFIERIIVAKGLDKINDYIDGIALPTPLAVLEAVKTLNEASGQDVLVIDIGGATTDVHSAAYGLPADAKTVLKGLPEPFAKRTVEGDLGVRHNISSIVEGTGKDRFMGLMAGAGYPDTEPRICETLELWAKRTESIANDGFEMCLDSQLAFCATQIAVARHAGVLEQMWTPDGRILVQYGKDLTGVKTLIGTGGPLINSRHPGKILSGALFEDDNPFLLKPRRPRQYIDKKYALFAVGLLRTVDPAAARRLATNYLKEIEVI